MSAMKSLGAELQRVASRLPAPRIVPATAEVIDIAAGSPGQPPLYLTRQELGELGYKQVRTWKGEMAWVSPMFWMNGEPFYPPVHIEPGEKRRAQEEAMRAAYQAYRDEKKKRQGGKW